MSIVTLSTTAIQSACCPAGKQKTELFDTEIKGLSLEVRASGGKTYYLRYRDPRGHQRQYRIGDTKSITLIQARKLATKLLGQIAFGIDPAAEKVILRTVPTFASFVSERYMPFVKGYKRSWNSDDSYLRNHLLPAFGKKYLDEITKHDVIAFHHGMRAKGYALNLVVRWEIPGVTSNPTKDVALFEDPNKKERYLLQEEAHRLYEAVCVSDNKILKYIIPMLILTGARKREVLDSKWEDFDLVHKQWRIPYTKSGKPRHVPLSDGVLQLLSTIKHDPDCPWVFPNPKTHKPYVSFYYSWDTARKLAGLADVRIHDLRHSFASFLVNAGRSLYEVQKILGHTQVKTTQRYAHLAQGTLIDAANSAMNALGGAFLPAHLQIAPVELALAA